MQKLIILIFCCFFIGGISAQNRKAEPFGNILEQFDDAYKVRRQLFQNKIAAIDSLKHGRSELSSAEQLLRMETIGEAYRKVKVDSAAIWFARGADLASTMGDSVTAQRLSLKKIAIWPEIGLVKLSEAEFDSIRMIGIYPENLLVYYEEGARMLAYAAWCTSYDHLHDWYQGQSNVLNDSLVMAMSDVNSVTSRRAKALQAYHTGNEKHLLKEADSLIQEASGADYMAGEIMALLGIYYKDNGDYDKAAYYLAKSATSDMLNGRIESPAMEELIDVFEDIGDLKRASLCAIAALQNANESGANRRIVQVMEPIPNVLTASNNKNSRMIVELYCLVGVLIAGLVFIIILVIKYRSKLKYLHSVKEQLAHANYMKEAYMNRFMGLCSMYMQKTGDFMRLATRKINAKQHDELFSYIRSGKLLD